MARGSSYQTKGIVIGRTNFGEADRVVRFITPEHGKVSTVAKGVRKIKSRTGGHLELFGEVSLMLAPGRNLELITSAQLLWYPHTLMGHYDGLGIAFMIATITDRLTEPDQPMPSLYAVIREALGALNDGAGGPLIELWFKLRLLNLLGYQPELGGCVICGRTDADVDYYFSANRGGIVCQTDASAFDPAISQTAIKLWRLLCDYPYATIAHIENATALAADTIELCDTFYEHHLGRRFKPSLTGDIT